VSAVKAIMPVVSLSVVNATVKYVSLCCSTLKKAVLQ